MSPPPGNGKIAKIELLQESKLHIIHNSSIPHRIPRYAYGTG
jgi:hypothetical protein